MATVAASATVLVCFFGASLFLLFVAVLSFYLAFKGVRALRRKDPARGRATAVDWLAALLAVAASAGFAFVASDPAKYRLSKDFAPVAAAFALVLFLTAAREVATLVRPPTAPGAWRLAHMTGMLGASVAFVTAFSAVNFGFLPIVLRWLWPTAVGSVGIAIWIRRQRRRFAATSGAEGPQRARGENPAVAS